MPVSVHLRPTISHTKLTEPALPSLHRVRRYLRSTGRYGSSPFLVGYYGGTGEIAQGFCRVSAVSGGVYILGRCVDNELVSLRTLRALVLPASMIAYNRNIF